LFVRQILGGQETESGRLGSFIKHVDQGSLANRVGGLREGDEIVQWNRQNLQDLDHEAVEEIVKASKRKNVVRYDLRLGLSLVFGLLVFLLFATVYCESPFDLKA